MDTEEKYSIEKRVKEIEEEFKSCFCERERALLIAEHDRLLFRLRVKRDSGKSFKLIKLIFSGRSQVIHAKLFLATAIPGSIIYLVYELIGAKYGSDVQLVVCTVFLISTLFILLLKLTE